MSAVQVRWAIVVLFAVLLSTINPASSEHHMQKHRRYATLFPSFVTPGQPEALQLALPLQNEASRVSFDVKSIHVDGEECFIDMVHQNMSRQHVGDHHQFSYFVLINFTAPALEPVLDGGYVKLSIRFSAYNSSLGYAVTQTAVLSDLLYVPGRELCAEANNFYPIDVGFACLACPVGAICPGGGRAWPELGYWSAHERDVPVKCAIPARCPGTWLSSLPLRLPSGATDTAVCSAGYDGFACGVCESGYGFRAYGGCLPCGAVMPVRVVFGLLAAFCWLVITQLMITYVHPHSGTVFVLVVMVLQNMCALAKWTFAQHVPNRLLLVVSEIFSFIALLVGYDPDFLVTGCWGVGMSEMERSFWGRIGYMCAALCVHILLSLLLHGLSFRMKPGRKSALDKARERERKKREEMSSKATDSNAGEAPPVIQPAAVSVPVTNHSASDSEARIRTGATAAAAAASDSEELGKDRLHRMNSIAGTYVIHVPVPAQDGNHSDSATRRDRMKHFTSRRKSRTTPGHTGSILSMASRYIPRVPTSLESQREMDQLAGDADSLSSKKLIPFEYIRNSVVEEPSALAAAEGIDESDGSLNSAPPVTKSNSTQLGAVIDNTSNSKDGQSWDRMSLSKPVLTRSHSPAPSNRPPVVRRYGSLALAAESLAAESMAARRASLQLAVPVPNTLLSCNWRDLQLCSAHISTPTFSQATRQMMGALALFWVLPLLEEAVNVWFQVVVAGEGELEQEFAGIDFQLERWSGRHDALVAMACIFIVALVLGLPVFAFKYSAFDAALSATSAVPDRHGSQVYSGNEEAPPDGMTEEEQEAMQRGLLDELKPTPGESLLQPLHGMTYWFCFVVVRFLIAMSLTQWLREGMVVIVIACTGHLLGSMMLYVSLFPVSARTWPLHVLSLVTYVFSTGLALVLLEGELAGEHFDAVLPGHTPQYSGYHQQSKAVASAQFHEGASVHHHLAVRWLVAPEGVLWLTVYASPVLCALLVFVMDRLAVSWRHSIGMYCYSNTNEDPAAAGDANSIVVLLPRSATNPGQTSPLAPARAPASPVGDGAAGTVGGHRKRLPLGAPKLRRGGLNSPKTGQVSPGFGKRDGALHRGSFKRAKSGGRRWSPRQSLTRGSVIMNIPEGISVDHEMDLQPLRSAFELMYKGNWGESDQDENEDDAQFQSGSSMSKKRSSIMDLKADAAVPEEVVFGTPGSHDEMRVRLGRMIGRGAYGRVFMGMDRDSGAFLAVKCMKVNPLLSEEDTKLVEGELARVVRLRHPNLIFVHDYSLKNGTLNVLMEYATGLSITNLMRMYGKFSEDVLRRYLAHILNGLQFLHSFGIAHNDLKGSNILMQSNGAVKLSDLAITKAACVPTQLGDHKEKSFQLFSHTAPELLATSSGKTDNLAGDVWSIGCVVLGMVTNQTLLELCDITTSQEFSDWVLLESDVELDFEEICRENGLSRDLARLIRACLQRNVTKRPTVLQLSQHNFFTRMHRSDGVSGGNAAGQSADDFSDQGARNSESEMTDMNGMEFRRVSSVSDVEHFGMDFSALPSRHHSILPSLGGNLMNPSIASSRDSGHSNASHASSLAGGFSNMLFPALEPTLAALQSASDITSKHSVTTAQPSRVPSMQDMLNREQISAFSEGNASETEDE